MNKKEVIQRLREHLRSLNIRLSDPEVYIPTWHYNWCITYIMDFLLVDRSTAKQIMNKEVLAGIKLLEAPKTKNKTSDYITPKIFSDNTGIPVNAIMYAIYGGKLIAFKFDDKHWAISKKEAKRFADFYKK